MRLHLFVPSLDCSSAHWKVNHVKVLICLRDQPGKTRTGLRRATNTYEAVIDSLIGEGFVEVRESEPFPRCYLTEAAERILEVSLGKETALIQSLPGGMPLAVFRCFVEWTQFATSDPSDFIAVSGLNPSTLRRYFRILADRGWLSPSADRGRWVFTCRGREVFEVPTKDHPRIKAAA